MVSHSVDACARTNLASTTICSLDSGFRLCGIVMLPTTSAELDLDGAQKVLKLLDMLEDLDDVQNVYSNAD